MRVLGTGKKQAAFLALQRANFLVEKFREVCVVVRLLEVDGGVGWN